MNHSEDLLLLAAHCNRWIREKDTNVIQPILEHPLSKRCLSDDGVINQTIYKTVFITKNPVSKISVSPTFGMLEFSTVHADIKSSNQDELQDGISCAFAVPFVKSNLLLNFTQLTTELRTSGYRIYIQPDKVTQLWMNGSSCNFTMEHFLGIHA